MMPVTPYQIVVPLLSLVVISYAWNLVSRQKKTVWEGCLWTLFWLTIAYVSLVPSAIQYLSDVTGIQNNENALVFTSIGILFFILFYLLLRIEELEQRITKIVREEALKEIQHTNERTS